MTYLRPALQQSRMEPTADLALQSCRQRTTQFALCHGFSPRGDADTFATTPVRVVPSFDAPAACERVRAEPLVTPK